jgi:hypothetical protein
VSFTIKTATVPSAYAVEPIRVRMIRPGIGNVATGLGASGYVTPTRAGGLQTFPVRLPIASGDEIGFDDAVTNGQLYPFYDNPFGPTCVAIASPRLAASGAVTTECNADWELLLRGRVEPDADHDAWGDETQDRCMGRSGPNNGCPLTHKKKCKRKKHRAHSGAAAAKKKHCKKRKNRS